MRITTKLTLINVALLVLLFLSLGWNSYRHALATIREETIDKARTIARQIIETREYLSSVISAEEVHHNFNITPQVASTRIALRLTQGTPYYVRQVSLRFRNPQNRPDAYEASELQKFSANRIQESQQVVGAKGQKTLRYLLSMTADDSCLVCHGSFETAPAFVQKRFPKGHPSYNYKVGEVIGAISVSVPMRELYHNIHANLLQELVTAGSILITLILVTVWIINRAILSPVANVSQGISKATTSGDFSTRIELSRNDEIGRLVTSFNELMAELERRTLQRAESDERYRNFIEIALSPIVTFLPDGKIVITNQKAEKLFGLRKEELIGQLIFDFMVDPEPLRKGISDYFTVGSSTMIGTTSRQTVRDLCGKLFTVEMVVSVSQSDHEAMFTAILRTTKD